MPEVVDETVFEGIISFMRDLGFFKVLLPFLLSFVLVYAILDKTKVLGTEDGKDDGDPKRSINAIVALCIGLFVVGSQLVVAVINQALANIVVVLLISVFFIMAVSVFLTGGQLDFQSDDYKHWLLFFMVAIFIIFVLIFLHALGWLSPMWEWLKANWNKDYVATILFLLGIAAFIALITREGNSAGSGGAGGGGD